MKILASTLVLSLGLFSATAQNIVDSIPLSVVFDQEIVVTGQFSPTEIKNSVLPVRIITKEMIERRAAMNLIEVLQQEVGIKTQRDPILGNSISMNGLNGKHIKILIDGVPMIGRSNGNLDLDRIQVQQIERIEIIENAMSVNYGTNALGGTINIITKKNHAQDWDAQVMGQIQSNQQYNFSSSLSHSNKYISSTVNYNLIHFDGFSTDTLRSLEWNPKTQHAVNAQLNFLVPKSTFKINYQLNFLNEKIIDFGLAKLAAFPDLSYAKDYHFISKSHDHALSAVGYLSPKKRYYLDVMGAFNHFNREKNSYWTSLNDNTSPDTLDHYDSDTTQFEAINVRATLASNYLKKFDFQVGFDGRYDYLIGDRIQDQRGVLFNYALFASIQHQPISLLKINAGIRVAYNSLAKFPITYSAGFKLNIIDGMNVRFSYARGIRTPSIKELYLDFVDRNHHIKGNPNLTPEYAHNLRLSWTYNKMFQQKHLVRMDLSGFYNYIEQQISIYNYELDSSGNYLQNPNSDKYAYFNLDEYRNWGINFRFSYQFKGLNIQIGANLTGHFNNLSENINIIDPFSYTTEFSQQIGYNFKKIGLTLTLFRRDYDRRITYVLKYDPISQTNVIQQNSLDGYALMDFNISKQLFKKAVTINAGVKNILNVGNINQIGSSGAHGNSTGNVSVGMGRVVFISIQYKPFNFK